MNISLQATGVLPKMRAGWKSAGRQSKAQLQSQAEINITSILEKKRLRRNICGHPARAGGNANARTSAIPAVSSNTMDTSQDDDIKYYDKRVKEFDKLLAEAKSQTLIDLLKKAKGDSEKAIEKLIEIQKATIVYLKNYELKNDEALQKFQKQIDLQLIEVRKLKEANIDRTLKGSILQIHEEVADKINDSLTQREEIRKLTFKVFTSCANDFRITLLEKIFKPADAKFHYETIIDVLNYIIGKIVPLLDEAKTVANFSATKRRKQFANHGDKILIYLEQYIDVLEKWTILGNALIKLTED